MTGPLILITLGVLFLLNNLDPIRFDFGRMWPVILIVIGLVKIFEYFGRSARTSNRHVRGSNSSRTRHSSDTARADAGEADGGTAGQAEERQ